MFLFTLFVGIIAPLQDDVGAFVERHGWGGAALSILIVVACTVQAGFSSREFKRTTSIYYADMPSARSFLKALIGDLSALRRGGTVVLADGEFPRFLDWMDLELRWYSQLVPTLGEQASFGTGKATTHRIDDTGHVVPVKR